MKNKKYLLVIIIAICFSSIVVLAYKLYRNNAVEPATQTISGASASAEIRNIGEEAYRKKAYAPLVAVYEKMLASSPENIEVKKKLAFAYFAAAQYEKAKPLLEEVSRKVSADDEVNRELEFIREREEK